MMFIRFFFTWIFLPFLFTLNQERKNCDIEFNYNYTRINSDTVYVNNSSRVFTLERMQKLLGEVPKKKKLKKDGMIDYYFIHNGIKATTPILDPKKPIALMINFMKNENLNYNVDLFSGTVQLFNVAIDKNTTFKDLYNNKIIRPLINYSYYGDTTNLKAGYIIITTKYASYNINFSNADGDSPIVLIDATL